MGGIQQGGVVGCGEAAPFALAGTVHLDPVQQPDPVTWFDADQPGHGDAAGAFARHRDHRCLSTRRPGPRLGRPKRVTRLVLEADPRPTFGRYLFAALLTCLWVSWPGVGEEHAVPA